MSYDAPSTAAFLRPQQEARPSGRGMPMRAGRGGDRPAAGRGRDRPAAGRGSARRFPPVRQGVPTPQPKPQPVVVVAPPKPVAVKKKIEKEAKPPKPTSSNVFSVLREDEEGLGEDVCVINDLHFALRGALTRCGLGYKQHFTPYRPTEEQRAAAHRPLPPSFEDEEEENNHQKKEKPNGDLQPNEKGKEKADQAPNSDGEESADDAPSSTSLFVSAVESAVDIFIDENKIVKPEEHITDILYKGRSVFYEADDVSADTFFVDETKIAKTELEFKVPESKDTDKFFAGYEPAPPVPVAMKLASSVDDLGESQAKKKIEGKHKREDPSKKEAKVEEPKRKPTKEKKIEEAKKERKAEDPSQRLNRQLEPEEEEIEKMRLLLDQGFIPHDEFERRKTEMLNAMKKRHQLNLETEKERKRLEAEQLKKLLQAEKKYKMEKLEEERLWSAKEKLRAHQMKLKIIAEEGFDAKLNFDDNLDPVSDPSTEVDLDKILQCVEDSSLAMQIYEFLVSQQQSKKKSSRNAKMCDLHDARHILATTQTPNQKKIKSMADVLRVLHTSGHSGSAVLTAEHPQLPRSQVLPTRQNMHLIERIATKDPTMVQAFLKQVKKERKLRLRYQQELQKWRLSVSDNATN